MKGFVLAYTVKFLTRKYGDQFSKELRQSMKGPQQGPYSYTEVFPDNTFAQLISNAATLLGMPSAELSRIIGANFFSELIKLNPPWADHNTNAFDLLKRHDMAMNEIVRMHLPGLEAPSFTYNQISPKRLDLNYRSTFMSGDVAEGLIAAMFVHYDEDFTIERRNRKGLDNYNEQFILRIRPISS